MHQSKSSIFELEWNWVEPMSASLEKIVGVMGKWFKPEEMELNLVGV